MWRNWITAGTAKPFYVRREIVLSGKIAKATAKVCGLGQFVLHINGKKVGDHELDPGWTDYRKYIEYVTFDVTDQLQEGANAIGAEIGNGWFIMENEHYSFHFPPFMPPNPNPYTPFGNCLVFGMELTVCYADGREEVFSTDQQEGWKTCPHPVTMSNVYGSETVDFSLEQPGFDQTGFDDHAWLPALTRRMDQILQKAGWQLTEEEEAARNAGKETGKITPELLEQDHPAVKVIREYPGICVREFSGFAEGDESRPEKIQIYDFSQNMAGILILRMKGKKGDVITIYPAEKLTEDGHADQMAKGWMPIDNVITLILGDDDKEEEFRQRFTYFAGKYIEIHLPKQAEILSVRAEAITAAWKNSGTFTTDDERFQKIYDMIERTLEANILSVHTDCPTIERFAWQEPNHLMAPAIFFVKDGEKLWRKYLRDLRVAQHTAEDTYFDFAHNRIPAGDGLEPSQAPCYIPNVLPVPGMGSFYDIIAWGSTIILGTMWHYRFYHDVTILQENYEAGKRYLAYLETKLDENGFISHGLGDWGNPDGLYARENIETALLYEDAVELAEMAGILAEADATEALRADADHDIRLAEEVRENYNAKLLARRENGKYAYRVFEVKDAFRMTQAAEAMPLLFGMVPEEAIEDVKEAFRETLLEREAFIAGEVGLPYIIRLAGKYGWHDLIARFVTREEHPSYYAFVKDGMTTLGEFWETNPRSHCHDMMGHILEWYFTGIAGIRPVTADWREIEVHPYLPEGMNRFTCTFSGAAGSITVHAERKDNGEEIRSEIRADEGITIRE